MAAEREEKVEDPCQATPKPLIELWCVQYFGEGVPFGDPYWYQGFASPYYNASHIAYRAKCRKFVEDEILPYADEWSRGDGPGYPYKELHPKGYQAGVLGVIYPPEFGGTVPEGATKSDAFHELIMWDELSRCGTIPAAEGILGQHSINSMALPPVMKYGNSPACFFSAPFLFDSSVGGLPRPAKTAP